VAAKTGEVARTLRPTINIPVILIFPPVATAHKRRAWTIPTVPALRANRLTGLVEQERRQIS
jgi:hypothetical protein